MGYPESEQLRDVCEEGPAAAGDVTVMCRQERGGRNGPGGNTTRMALSPGDALEWEGRAEGEELTRETEERAEGK